jgi:hypothetical protein
LLQPIVFAGEVVVRIPTSACLTCGDCKHSASVAELQKSLGEKEWLAALGFALMLERGTGDDDAAVATDVTRVVDAAVTTDVTRVSSSSSSRWAPYLAVLPASEPNVVGARAVQVEFS